MESHHLLSLVILQSLLLCVVATTQAGEWCKVCIYRNVTKEHPLMKEHPYANEHPYMKECPAPKFCLTLKSKFTVMSAHAPVLYEVVSVLYPWSIHYSCNTLKQYTTYNFASCFSYDCLNCQPKAVEPRLSSSPEAVHHCSCQVQWDLYHSEVLWILDWWSIW